MNESPAFDLIARAAARLDLSNTRATAAAVGAPVAEAETSAAELRATARSPGAPRGQLEIDFVRLQKQGILTPQALGTRIAEEFRLIKRPLLRIASESRKTDLGNGHVIMVTSAHPDDGKTFIATNLAVSMACERDLFVLAIDADIRRKGFSHQLGMGDRPGIMDVLLDPNIAIADVMLRTDIPNLAVIPAGNPVQGATELFASQRMTKLVNDVATRYKDRIIVFDAPPVLAATEPGVLALHVGQIAFVVKSGETSKRSIAEALRLIDVCPNVHFVVNELAQPSGDDSFGFYGY